MTARRQAGSVTGGHSCNVNNLATNGTVVGGQSNNVYVPFAVIRGGQGCSVGDSGNYGTVLGGSGRSVAGPHDLSVGSNLYDN